MDTKDTQAEHKRTQEERKVGESERVCVCVCLCGMGNRVWGMVRGGGGTRSEKRRNKKRKERGV